MLEEIYLDLILAVISLITASLFVFMYNKRAYPKLWIVTAITLAIGSFVFLFRHIDQDYRIFGNIFYLLTTLFLGFSIIFEYFQKIISNEKIKSKLYLILSILISNFLIIIILGIFQVSLINVIQISVMFFLFLIAFIMIRLYNKEKSITHILMLFTVIFSFLTLFFSVLHNYNLELCWEFAYIMKVMLYATLLLTATSAPIENRRKEIEKRFWESFSRAEFYKDVFIHDINNMLQIILSAIQILLIKNPNLNKEREQDYLKMIKNQVYRGSKLIENLRMLSYLEKKEFFLKNLEIVSKLKYVLNQIRDYYKDKNIDIQIETYAKSIYIHANELIKEVFHNLLTNAIEHNDNKEIFISVRIKRAQQINQNFLRIEIEDNGKGIEDSRKKSIFSRAFKIDNDLRGLGLGLSLVNKILNIFNGKIWVEDRVEGDYSQGSKFIMLIPQIEK
ncbi:MAG: putative Histidine kinase [Promethearchaeota archaeon]|nr:MAG: putative Histidine kinase [Candidatus Lokiarchaeota archaeon]